MSIVGYVSVLFTDGLLKFIQRRWMRNDASLGLRLLISSSLSLYIVPLNSINGHLVNDYDDITPNPSKGSNQSCLNLIATAIKFHQNIL